MQFVGVAKDDLRITIVLHGKQKNHRSQESVQRSFSSLELLYLYKILMIVVEIRSYTVEWRLEN